MLQTKHLLFLLLLVFSYLLSAQTWESVTEYEKKGLPQSADSVAMRIYNKEKAAKDYPKAIKAFLYHAKFTASRSEDGIVDAFLLLEKEANESQHFLEKALLKSYTADLLWAYFEAEQYRIIQRSATAKFEKKDVKTWSANDFVENVRILYLQSLKDAKQLQAVPVENIKEILAAFYNVQENEKYKTTAYDVLAHEVVAFLMNENISLSKPAYQFKINDIGYFSLNESFAKMPISSPDTSDYKLYAMKLLQEITAFHLANKNDYALAHTDLLRLKWVRDNFFDAKKKNELYLAALQKLYTFNQHKSCNILIAIELAIRMTEKSYDSQDEKKTNQFAIKEAYDFLKSVLQENNAAYEAPTAYNLLCAWEAKNISVQMGELQAAEKPILIKISYRNTDRVFLRAVRLDEKTKKQLFEDFQEENQARIKAYGSNYTYGLPRYWFDSMLISLKPTYEWAYDWKMNPDMREHSFEQKLAALPAGEYLIISSLNADFKESESNILAMNHCQVTNFTYAIRQDIIHQVQQISIVNSQTGEPQAGVKVEICGVEQNTFKPDLIRSTKPKIEHVYTSDKNGLVEIPYLIEYDVYLHEEKLRDKIEDTLFVDYQYYIKFSTAKDSYFTMQSLSNINPHRQLDTKDTYEPSTHCQLFTDRSIYRPGQTVYFKGILFEQTEKAYKTLKNEDVKVILRNGNWQQVSDLHFKTNEYGSFQGSFVLPSTGLTGNFTLESESPSQRINFRVEEYKRPKFEVRFDTLKGNFKIGEKIKVTGIAQNYAGNMVQDAKVNYRIVRSATFPYWYDWYWWRPMPYSQGQEVAKGTITTNAEGKFDIEFLASLDSSINADNKPQYQYKVYADVIDLSGETHSAEISPRAGYIDIDIQFSLPKKIDLAEKEMKYSLSSVNTNQIFTPATGTLTAYKLEDDRGYLRQRNWVMPDEFVLTESEFKKIFPNEPYKNEQEVRSRKRVKEVFSLPFNTATDKEMDFSNRFKALEIGHYVVEINTQDAFGTPLTKTYFFDIEEIKKNKLANPQILYVNTDKPQGKLGEKSEIFFGSTENIWVFVEESNGKFLPKGEWFNLKNTQAIKTFIHTGEKNGYKNFQFTTTYLSKNVVQNLLLHSYNQEKEDNNLKLEFSTFRNKLQPGQKETWQIKVTGENNAFVAAELMACMYDGSLDAFTASQYWHLPQHSPFDPDANNNRYNVFPMIWSNSRLEYTGYNFQGLHLQKNYRYCSFTQKEAFSYPKRNNFAFRKYYDSYDDWGFSSDESLGEVVIMNFKNSSFEKDPNAQGAISEGEELMKIEEEPEPTKFVPNTNNKNPKTGPLDYLERLQAAENDKKPLPPVQVRTNFQETAFFMPQLHTNAKGEVIIEFTIPESLTKWHFKALAHTKMMQSGILEKNDIVTQKDLMVFPNMPRFLREGDKITLAAKISNLTDELLDGTAQLLLFDALTMKPIDALFSNQNNSKSFTCGKKGSIQVSFDIKVPFGIQAVVYRITAQSGNFSDGEENALPILTNRMLVTETLPLPIRGGKSKDFVFEKLKNNPSKTLTNHSLTLEITSNPVWYAIQALPYLMEYPYECAEQTFSRLYANALATQIANSNPEIKQVFDTWKNTPAELSNLEKNQEVKNILLEETPWVRDAQDETQRKKRIGILFDLELMNNQYAVTLEKLKEMQLSDGGFAWFKGARASDIYITQHIVAGFGKLDHLKVEKVRNDATLWTMLRKAVAFVDADLGKRYNDLVENKNNTHEYQRFSSLDAHYFYARSFFKDIPIAAASKTAFDFYAENIAKFWLSQSNYEKGLCALGLHRFGNDTLPQIILKSLKEFSLNKEEMGMYIPPYSPQFGGIRGGGYYWYEAPIETQALMIEAFDEINDDKIAVDDMRTWLLKQKQTQDWKTTKATVEAIYALLLRGSNSLETIPLEVTVGGKKINNTAENSEKGTGYYKQTWQAAEIKPSMANISLTNPNKNVAWGAMYWQYFEDLDKITPSETPLKLNKALFLQKTTDKGLILEPISETTPLQVGDLVKVRIEIRVDRAMEYIHLKDMRASGFEPVNVLSQYKWQDGLGYYESTRDAATNFFISYLPKGTYVFEYPLRVAQKGDMSNGITQIQCMYAPEFSAHSEGIRVQVK